MYSEKSEIDHSGVAQEANNKDVENQERQSCFKSTHCKETVTCGQFKKKHHSALCWVFSLMLTSLFLAVIAPLVLYRIADSQINSEVVIDSEDAKNYDIWQTNAYGRGLTDTKVTYDLYYFDIQNPQAALDGAKPILCEVGPYAYDEYFIKFDIVWSDDGDTVTYYTQKYYVFNQDRSGPGLTEFDNITIPSPVISGFQYILSKIPANGTMFLEDKILSKLVSSRANVDEKLMEISASIDNDPDLNIITRRIAHNRLNDINSSVQQLYDNLFEFVYQSNPADLLMKTLMCGTPDGVSPFYTTTPSPAWFGWLNDTLLHEVTPIVNALVAATGKYIGWTEAVPGVTINWTTKHEARRRKMPDTMKTGKKNPNQVGQYVKYNNMKSLWSCISPMESQDPSQYRAGHEAPACEHWNESWDDETATKKGYVQPFATPYANRIQGTDANMFGRPIKSEKLQIFSLDIYRSGFMQYKEIVDDWYGVKLKRFGIQAKDMYNSSVLPENRQWYANGLSGVENLTRALNLPVYSSFPHFLYGDRRLYDGLEGIHPNEEAHGSVIDIEPQTGMIARATKRIQVNYLMQHTYLPSTHPDTLDFANSICTNITKLLDFLGPNAPPVDISCNLTVVTPLLTCWDIQSDWKFRDGGLFIPYGWVQEGVEMPQSKADDITNSLYVVDNIATGLQFWCLIIAGVSFAILSGMLINMYYHELHLQQCKAVYYTQKHQYGRQPLLQGDSGSEKYNNNNNNNYLTPSSYDKTNI